MATSYFQPRIARPCSSPPSEGADEGAKSSTNSALLEQSIYVFPNPSSAPPTSSHRSSRSSLISVPTDFDSSDSFSWPASRSRTPLRSARDDATPPPISQYTTDDEVWIDATSWDYSLAGDLDSDQSETWTLEDEVDRLTAAGIDFTLVNGPPHRTRPLHPHTRTSSARPFLRPRTLSTLSSLSSSLPSSSAPRPPAPHPRIHIPLLALISSWLAIDLDDPALRLLTHTDPGEAQSVLFPGHTLAQLAYSDDQARPARGEDRLPGEEQDRDKRGGAADGEHGLPRLLLASLSDQSVVAVRSLRAGLAVCASRSPVDVVGLPLTVPGAPTLVGLWRVVGEVCARGSQAWKEVWGERGSSHERCASQ